MESSTLTLTSSSLPSSIPKVGSSQPYIGPFLLPTPNSFTSYAQSPSLEIAGSSSPQLTQTSLVSSSAVASTSSKPYIANLVPAVVTGTSPVQVMTTSLTAIDEQTSSLRREITPTTTTTTSKRIPMATCLSVGEQVGLANTILVSFAG